MYRNVHINKTLEHDYRGILKGIQIIPFHFQLAVLKTGKVFHFEEQIYSN